MNKLNKRISAVTAALFAMGLASPVDAATTFVFDGPTSDTEFVTPTGAAGTDFLFSTSGCTTDDYCSVTATDGLSYSKDAIDLTVFGYTSWGTNDQIAEHVLQDIRGDNAGLGVTSEYGTAGDSNFSPSLEQVNFLAGEAIEFDFATTVLLSFMEFNTGSHANCPADPTTGNCGRFDLYIDGVLIAANTDLVARDQNFSLIGSNFLLISVKDGANLVGEPGFYIGSITATMVPEPATWIMMITGFAGMGLALRTRRRRLVVG